MFRAVWIARPANFPLNSPGQPVFNHFFVIICSLAQLYNNGRTRFSFYVGLLIVLHLVFLDCHQLGNIECNCCPQVLNEPRVLLIYNKKRQFAGRQFILNSLYSPHYVPWFFFKLVIILHRDDILRESICVLSLKLNISLQPSNIF